MKEVKFVEEATYFWIKYSGEASNQKCSDPVTISKSHENFRTYGGRMSRKETALGKLAEARRLNPHTKFFIYEERRTLWE